MLLRFSFQRANVLLITITVIVCSGLDITLGTVNETTDVRGGILIRYIMYISPNSDGGGCLNVSVKYWIMCFFFDFMSDFRGLKSINAKNGKIGSSVSGPSLCVDAILAEAGVRNVAEVVSILPSLAVNDRVCTYMWHFSV